MTQKYTTAIATGMIVIFMSLSSGAYAQHQHSDHHTHHQAIAHLDKTKAEAALVLALSASDRPERDLKRDQDRRAELSFVSRHILPGHNVIDIGAGGGYMTLILSSLVGERGHVTMQNPMGWIKNFKLDPLMDGLAAQRKNITPLKVDFDQLPLPSKPYDVVVSSMIYHDTVWLKVDREKMNLQTYEAMKPGGIYIVIDHRAEAGSGVRDVETLHRMEVKTIIEEISKSGLIFIHDHDDLANKDDNHTLNVFDPAIRGKTDRSILVFQKPKTDHAH